MTKLLNNKSLQAFLAIAPFVLIIIAFIGYFIFIFSIIKEANHLEHSNEAPVTMISGMVIFVVLIIIASIVGILSLIYYIIHALKNPNFKKSDNMQIVWVLIFFFLSGIGQLIYYLAEIALKNPRPIIKDEIDEIEIISGYQN